MSPSTPNRCSPAASVMKPWANSKRKNEELPTYNDCNQFIEFDEKCGKLTEIVSQKISEHLSPIDRLQLQQTCRHFNKIFGQWDNVTALEIRLEEYVCCSEGTNTSKKPFVISKILTSNKKTLSNGARRLKSYHIKLTTTDGSHYQLRTTEEKAAIQTMRAMLSRQSALSELTIWDACLTSEFAQTITQIGTTIEILRLWNCGGYFSKKSPNREKIIEVLLALPRLKQLLILDTSSFNPNTVSPIFSKFLAAQICAPLENLQLTNLYLPLRSLEIIAEKLARSCSRLAIGCTFGKSTQRLLFLNAISRMKKLADIDFPPFIFHLNDKPTVDEAVRKLINSLPIMSIGFRHYNSSVLFRFIETQLPRKIRILRIHHSVNRIPNFSELGQNPPLPEDVCTSFEDDTISNSSALSTLYPKSGSFSFMREKKLSIATGYSALSSSSSSICSAIENSFVEFIKNHRRWVNNGGTYENNNNINNIEYTGVFPGGNECQIKSRETTDYNDESKDGNIKRSRRFTVGSRHNFSQLQTSSSISNISRCDFLSNGHTHPYTKTMNLYGDPNLRKHSLDCQNQSKKFLPIVRAATSLDDKTISQRCYCKRYHGAENDNEYCMRRFGSSGMIGQKFEAVQHSTIVPVAKRLSEHGLTIFAISEEKKHRRMQWLRKRRYCGVDVIYVQESIDTQEILGWMASPMQSPHVYSKSLSTKCSGSSKRESRFRIIKGDLVKPIPLSSLGMESDYEQSDWED